MIETPVRLRRIGRIVLVGGVVAAAIVYWIQVRALTVSDAGSAFQHTRSADNQMGRMMGQFGLVMADWQATLSTPAAYAVGVLVVALLFAGYFFRVASVTEEEARERERGERR